MRYFNDLPIELQELILEYTNIKCRVCHCNFNIEFYKKVKNSYFCSEVCYNLI